MTAPVLNHRLTVDLRAKAAKAQSTGLQRIVSPAKAKPKEKWCPNCEINVRPILDSSGNYCPYCQTNLPSPMESIRP